ncbi:MAG: response regulator [Planctomycetia bacterium]|jgi:two-component system chemotaxis response regulator CheY
MSIRVLVADDSSTMRKIIIRALGALGIDEITEADNGETAINLFPTAPFDLVLTDWNMPAKTGLEVIQAIREINKETPIIMITTEAEKRRVVEAIQAGVTDYLVKPFEADDLKQKVEKHCPSIA